MGRASPAPRHAALAAGQRPSARPHASVSHSRQIQRVDSASRASLLAHDALEHARGQALEVGALGGGEVAQRLLEHAGRARRSRAARRAARPR